MSENSSTYNHNGKPPSPTSESLQLAHRFVKAIAEYNWTVDYVKFCELLELEPGDFADEQYRYFQQLAEALTRFDAESLAKMIDAGEAKVDG
ncbi:hypothetical protein H6G80_30165 [Nostoc sp. FACHB-87]|uniref:hypothetical protein n=1 Tax=Nostocales TaxID=1161 RepID=UPI001682E3A0|nr:MULTISPECIES: hypothetical protein [Nostocales]MBD2303816.1 hypothetical protein [Nostoc sp. FACHB-190]MBD2458320.1 hypothetical protein [Nostoc sp. FACHB-87]MBD2479468.1 hypothetical protein [Anabaena sp. FACHB-83]MBD2491237.1 hypothetical protein [Aulosira sp. FACHB-615]